MKTVTKFSVKLTKPFGKVRWREVLMDIGVDCLIDAHIKNWFLHPAFVIHIYKQSQNDIDNIYS